MTVLHNCEATALQGQWEDLSSTLTGVCAFSLGPYSLFSLQQPEEPFENINWSMHVPYRNHIIIFFNTLCDFILCIEKHYSAEGSTGFTRLLKKFMTQKRLRRN